MLKLQSMLETNNGYAAFSEQSLGLGSVEREVGYRYSLERLNFGWRAGGSLGQAALYYVTWQAGMRPVH